ncbi:6216_t:CDS:2 [Acaulospora colombiana]|uniref:6216_t:CDS:1 n=1 Tax=Acaulospora colombiana TaxID=27376 RepID=A0ACA9NKG6_9GLOM|nr:6216_t:CDS:2 [Acaulospora colombiana]
MDEEKLLPAPAVIQGIILAILALEASRQLFGTAALYLVLLLISVEGICGGLAYVNVYYHIGKEELLPKLVSSRREEGENMMSSWSRERQNEWIGQAKEFRIGSMGFADSFGILLASLIAIPTEIELCRAQVQRGKGLCKQL